MKNELKIIWRLIKNDRALSILKVAGLFLAFGVTIPLVSYVAYQKSFDRFHPGNDRILNVYIDETYQGTKDVYGECPLAIGQYLKDLFPEVESMVRTKDKSDVLISKENGDTFKESVLYTDPSFVNVFYLKVISGDKASFLQHPGEVYIAKSFSKKIFGDINSVGKPLRVDGQNFTVSGVFDNYPTNSHLKFNVLLPLKSYVHQYNTYGWDSDEFLTYIKLTKAVNIKTFGRKIQTLITQYWIPWLKTHYNLDYVFNDKNSIRLKTIPIVDIHLRGSFISSFEKQSNVSVIYISLTIVIVLLLIAYFNLMGFAFSKGKKLRIQNHIKHFLGGSKSNILTSFILENLTYTLIAFLLALGFTALLFNMHLPALAGMSNIAISYYITPVTGLLLLAVLISIICGLVLGMYFNRIAAQKNTTKTTNYSTFWLNRVILITQMAASIILLISIISIYKQLRYISRFNLGIDTQNVVIINQAYKIREHYSAFKTELKKSPLIQDVSCSNSFPFSGITTGSYILVDSPNQTPYPFPYFNSDIGFKDVFKCKMIKGRWFSDDMPSDKNAVILNKAAVKKMGMKAPIGEELYDDLSRTEKVKVIGVVDDFNFRSLHYKVEPLIIKPLKKNDWWRYIEIKGNTSDRKKLIAEIKLVWNKISGNEYLNASFLDDKIAVLYVKDVNTKRSIGLFSLVAILITCFGLLGTVLNISKERTKEIGIRKVNGAKISEVMTMLNKDFIKWVAIAFVIATPIAWFAMNKWLENFAYKTSLSWWIFALAGILALGIALLTVSWQSWKAATRNPIEALRYE